MKPRRLSTALVCLAFGLVALPAVVPGGHRLATAAPTPPLPPPAARWDFHTDVQPLLERACLKCHGPEKPKGKFRLDTRAGLLEGGESGKAVLPGRSADSPLVRYVARLVEDMEMPPEKKEALSAAEVGILRAWIDAGATYPPGTVLGNKAVVAAKSNTAVMTKKPVPPLPPAATRKVSFVADVQPIFAAHCYGCHGPLKQESGLRLDHKPTVMNGGEHGLAVVPGKSAESLIIQFVGGQREEGVMPKSGPPLSAAQIGILRAWIDQGAEFPDAASVVIKDKRTDHWAFKAPQKPGVPSAKDPAWAKNPVDAFVHARLDKEGLAPSPSADRITLLRRLSFDLIGLPPTVAEVDAFLADKSPNAYEKQVDRLLASPHYGERWGRHWLDAARYADSEGFEKDKPRSIWFYRDWVINAINRDMPYDRFVIEQVAGDMLPGATQDQLVATGFLRNSMVNEEGGVHPEQFRMDAMFDRMDAIGKSVLGLTVQCAQCHTHKFDPITHEEYYRLFAFLNNDDEPMPPVFTPEEQKQRTAVLSQINALEQSLQAATPDWQAKMAAWEAQAKKGLPTWTVLQAPFNETSLDGMKFLPQKDGSYLCQGFAATKSNAKVMLETDKTVGAIQFELLTDPNLPRGGPGRSVKGTGALSEFEVQAAPKSDPDAKKKVVLVEATADYAQPEGPLEALFDDKTGKQRLVGPASFAIDDKLETAWATDAGPGLRNSDRKAVFVPKEPIQHPGGTILTITLRQQHGGWNADDNQSNNLGRFRFSVAPTRAKADPVPKRVREIFAIPAPRRTPAQVAEMFRYYRTTVPAWKKQNDQIQALWAKYPEGTNTLVFARRPEPRVTTVLKRGDFLKPGKPVTPGVPAVLHPMPAGAPPNRLGFAQWLVDKRSPTTARVLVNRVWQAYFGMGLVGTPEDLGTQGEAPTHPELLDWLAVEFFERGQRLKNLHRIIVNSQTYKQASLVKPDLYARDPNNRLLARGARFRVEGEIVRDVFLASSGLLNPKVGGRSVMPLAPAFLFLPPVSFAPFPWVDETGGENYRRALYTFRRRSTPYPMLQTFDAPSADTSCVRRVRSNTPLQALVTLNEPLSIQAAQALARRMLEIQPGAGAANDRARIAHGFRRVLSRPPSEPELTELEGLLTRQRPRLAEGWLNPWLLATGKTESPMGLPTNTNPSELAAYTVVARVLLNLDEAITKE
ncbi:MAG TPA: PSD1 and planctomycete cytochrome C domain-containing protein [Polyangia bacterium]